MNAGPRKGLSLVELMVTIGIVVIIGGILARFLVIGGAAWHSGDAEIQATQEARKGIMYMTRELRQANLASLANMAGAKYAENTGVNYNSIVLRVVTVVAGNNNYGAYGSVITNAGTPNLSAPISYYVNNNQLIRLQNNTAKVLANNVTGLTFRLQNDSYTLNDGQEYSLATLLITLQTTKTTAERRQIPMTLTSAVLLRD
ncbi:MAG: hypothetical protein WC317_02055 [Candidatus Omnitrophota bacterium]